MQRASDMGAVLAAKCLTPDKGAYPRFPYSPVTGAHASSSAVPTETSTSEVCIINPDTGGVVGYAFLALYEEQAGSDFLELAAHVADVLAKNMREGDATRSPWPRRADAATGACGDEWNPDMAYVLRLFDGLLERGQSRYQPARDSLWNWIKKHQLKPWTSAEGTQWTRRCENNASHGKPNVGAPLEMARYLIERKETLDSHWRTLATRCIQFAAEYSATAESAHPTISPTTEETSRLGGVAALLYAAGGAGKYKKIAYHNLNRMTYFIDHDCTSAASGNTETVKPGDGEDCRHEDAIHNFVDALLAVPEWADGPRGRAAQPQRIGFHAARYNKRGRLTPWLPLGEVIEREMAWYRKCSVESHGYPSWVCATFINDDYKPFKKDIVAACQNGMGILSYLKYWELQGRSDSSILTMARLQGDYLIKEALTVDAGVYPRFTRSTGNNEDFPVRKGSQVDLKYGENVIEPDKGGLAGYALVKLYDATGESGYLAQAMHNADCLLRNMREGTAAQAPWPFRVDSITGEHWGERNGDMVFVLRLFDALIEKGQEKYRPARDRLWQWIRDVQIPAPDSRDKNHWMQFFEDQKPDDNRTSWAPLEMARYLAERREKLDPHWKALAEQCFQFALRNFSKWEPGGVTTMCEQDIDFRAWGGACSKLGGVAAMLYAATENPYYGELAYRNLTWMAYHVDEDGCPGEITGYFKRLRRAGWQTDCHCDVIHNFADAFAAVPEWTTAMDFPSPKAKRSRP
jgi:hypothetical protein